MQCYMFLLHTIITRSGHKFFIMKQTFDFSILFIKVVNQFPQTPRKPNYQTQPRPLSSLSRSRLADISRRRSHRIRNRSSEENNWSKTLNTMCLNRRTIPTIHQMSLHNRRREIRLRWAKMEWMINSQVHCACCSRRWSS